MNKKYIQINKDEDGYYIMIKHEDCAIRCYGNYNQVKYWVTEKGVNNHIATKLNFLKGYKVIKNY